MLLVSTNLHEISSIFFIEVESNSMTIYTSSQDGWILAARTLRLPHIFLLVKLSLLFLVFGLPSLMVMYSSSVLIESDSLLTILALNHQGHIFIDRPCGPVIKDGHFLLFSFHFCITSNISIFGHIQFLIVPLFIRCLKVFSTIGLVFFFFFLLGLEVAITFLYNFGFFVVVFSSFTSPSK